ncbi:hypothetical protein CARUB_v10018400mg [Capsella rubella]|uniref:FAR1 domain-containing protein n=1 Tax=Capsella rubella TaxID=81985 RepID=R0FR95_9BRAS|nr:hypothetical protein CARUB_v10018400mg [Capsella rubella]
MDPVCKSPVIMISKYENEKKYELAIYMDFSSNKTACTTYKKYGGDHGFNVRKQQRLKKKDKVVILLYVCPKEGYRKEPKVETSYLQPITRCGCNAHMTCYLQKNGRYKIVSFEVNHNHDLVRTPMKHLMKVNQKIYVSQKQHANDADMSGISANATVEMMRREVGGRENLGFMEKDYRNDIYQKRMAKMEKGDAGTANHNHELVRTPMKHLFFYSMQLDEDDMITNIFWVDDRSISNYNLFGDVVCFDSTYKTNDYDRPFAPFVGVNYHKQTVFFVETFLGTVSGKQPKTILTDQPAAMAKAIVKKHNLTENKWLKNVFEVRAKWAVVYGRHTFTADIVSTQRSESMNDILKRYLKSSYELLSFFEHNELTANFKMMHTSSVLSATVEMLQHAKEVYTPEIFKLFQNKSEMVYEYKVSYRGEPLEHLVSYDATNQAIQCSGMNYSFAGILCRHALTVLDKKDVRRIPSNYILTRWSKEAKSRSISSYHLDTIPNETIASAAAEHVELTMCANEAACQLLKILEEKKKELVKANAWVLPISNVEHVEGEEEGEEVPNARGIKRKATVGRPKTKKNMTPWSIFECS